ncbi:copper homeostasis protein CutC [Ilyomonas limi]|uniref:PF03932 family protein CutC n=1 Tax=Ilyomonas limi TaxID=2575867 RepID=A0A4U3L4P9_9BACT|nr:copper homeostasis protein CutC [Ilyomonas limi]TKK68547.1 copper homeostasis protein CutC [Ilyomonas limi]
MKSKFIYSPLGDGGTGGGFRLEIACFDIASAIRASAAGADRIELCDNAAEGGTTPSYGILKRIKELLHIPVFPIIRPRGGDFLYSNEEYKTMLYDVQLCNDLGFEGVVFGLLTNMGAVDIKRTEQLVKTAGNMQVTFHRAFDRAVNPFHALESAIYCGCKRILTSGQVPNAYDGKELIKELIEQAENRIIIMPGSGVRSNNIAELVTDTGAVEIHSSARKMQPSAMLFTKKNMQETLDTIGVDEVEIRKMKMTLQNLSAN